ncbi:unnamed protein product [Fraxinus pennsylvanica]|uniref:Gnk2-homologous domain-containing protein n=1 Tax=Fraxinus pennsylvanica TaxID=56036 RepID=A0AAD2DPT5_9LAMI|nr:unnamed protein product [Fraxinus pennsylvanica]
MLPGTVDFTAIRWVVALLTQSMASSYVEVMFKPTFVKSVSDHNLRITMYNPQNITDQPDRFRTLLANTMNEAATEAADDLSGKKFATKQANFTAFQTLYTLAQCTPDLSSSDCNTCLRDGISTLPSCCNSKQGARVIFLSCNVRYETYPFYNSTLVPAPAPPPNQNTPPLPPPPPTRSTTNEGNLMNLK